MTTVLYSRSGGVVGFNLTTRIDTKDLAAGEARRIEQLIDKADFFTLPNQMMRSRRRGTRQGGAVPDDLQHEITVERDEQQHTVRVDDQELPPALEPLVEYLYDAAIEEGKRKRRGDDAER